MPSKALGKYLSHYRGIDDVHLEAFRLIKSKFKVESVLYAGSWIHLTPSLVFPYVVYVDFFAEMESMFNEPELLGYIRNNSETMKRPVIKFHKADYREGISEAKESFDLLISLSGGFASKYCKPYLRRGGLLFVNNEHYDASIAYVDSDYLLIGVFTHAGKLVEDKQRIHEYFLTKNNQPITLEMVNENSKKSPSKAKYKLKKKAPFYLFQKA
ncbi:class I SAM-dependent methyltransferase [Candidatus Bathyarchaeota archaeon]|nr:class I SAM-dependent methyltransferase [Candidatus Bathyarchaeota archaeon]